MNMNLSELINEILYEWAYRVEDGMPNPKNPTHLKQLGIVLSEMGLSHIKTQLVENLLTEKGKTPEKHVVEADKQFKNPILNKSIKYKNAKGEDAEGLVGNLLRLPAEHPGRKAAERLLPPDGSEERDTINKDLGGENQPEKPEEPTADKDGGEQQPQEDPIQKSAPMFDPKLDPAMGVRLDKEKETNAQLAKDAEKQDAESEKEVKPKEETDFNPIAAVDVQKEMPEADPETFGGESDIPDGIGEKELEQFNTDIKKVKDIVADAKAKGEKAPNINLCQITVPGTNLYCDDNLGIPRAEMPQFKGKAIEGSRAANMPVDKDGEVDTEPVFKEMLKQKGITVVQTQVPADKLKATQSELVGAKVVGMMGALEENPEHEKITAPIYVSRDGYVIDGHHRWAAIAAYNAANPDTQIPMKVQVIDQDIKDAIPMCNKFAEDIGIAAKKADANKETPTEPAATEKLPEPKEPNTASGGVIYSLGGGYYSDTPGGPAQYRTVESVVEKALIEGNEDWAYLLFEAVVNKVTSKGKTIKVQTIDPKNQKKATANAKAAASGNVTDNGPAVTANIAPDEDPATGKGAKEIDSKKFNSKKFTESTIRQKQAFDNVEKAYPKIKRHNYQYPNGSDAYLKKVMHPAAFEAMDTLIKLSKGGDFVPPISMVTDQYGAGKISAQMNELCIQAVMAFPPTKEGIAARNAFIQSLRENNKTIIKSKQTPILDDTWIDEFEGASNAFNGAMDRQHGVGKWKVVGTTWDVRSQNEDRGINYDDKGFSTDINIQVEAGGKRENVEISCKKDWKIFLLNAGLGDAENWYYTLGPENEKRAMDLMQKAAAKIKLSKEEIAELKSLSEQALSKAPVSNKKLQEDQYKSAIKGANIIDGIEPKELTRIYKEWIAGDYEGGIDKKGKVKSVKDPEFTDAAIKAHMKVGITNEAEFHAEMKRINPGYKPTKKYYKKAVVCINNMLAQTKTDDDAMAWHKSHMNITTNFIQDAAQTLVKDKEYRKMLLRKLQEAIPLKTMTEGVETMQIDSMYITQEHMGKLFGTTDWKDIRQYLDVQVINGEGVLVYKAKGKTTSQPISIAKIGIREKGRGYDGNPALEVKPSDEFEADMRRIEKELTNR
jgi:hypothetical protein